VFRTQYSACEQQTGPNAKWTKMTGNKWRCEGDGCDDSPFASTCSSCKEEYGCSRSVAVQCGAFRCASSSVRGPDKVVESIDWCSYITPEGCQAGAWRTTYTAASFCTKPMENSPECPALEVDSCDTTPDPALMDKCKNFSGQDLTACIQSVMMIKHAAPLGRVFER